MAFTCTHFIFWLGVRVTLLELKVFICHCSKLPTLISVHLLMNSIKPIRYNNNLRTTFETRNSVWITPEYDETSCHGSCCHNGDSSPNSYHLIRSKKRWDSISEMNGGYNKLNVIVNVESRKGLLRFRTSQPPRKSHVWTFLFMMRNVVV